MLLYNVTTIVEDGIAEEWEQWMRTAHIPAVMETGMFVSFRFLKVLDSPNEGVTYCAQFVAEHQEAYNTYLEKFAPALRAEVLALFKEQLVSFRTLMEYID